MDQETNYDLQDLSASRITLLVPAGTDAKDAEKFAMSYNGKVVICNAKEVEEAVVEEIIKTNQRGWFSWMNPWNWFGTKEKKEKDKEVGDNNEENEQEINEDDPPPPPEEPSPPSEEDEENPPEPDDQLDLEEDLSEPQLLTPKQVWVHNWVQKFGEDAEEAKSEWNLLTEKEKEFFVDRTETRNQKTIDQFIEEHQNAKWTKEYLHKQNVELI